MKDTKQRQRIAAQRTNLKARTAALTMKPSGGAKKKVAAGVNLDEPPESDWSSDFDGVDGRERSERRPKGKQPHTLTGKAASLANLKVGRSGERPKGPILTKPADADVYVHLRASGVPPIEAVVYFARGDERLSVEQWAKLATQWEKHPLTKDAWDRFNGAEWQSLDDEQRQDAALRLHLAQCAYLLYTTDINHPMAPMNKVNYAKNTILAKIAIDKNAGTDDKFTQFLQTLTANANAAAPDVWKEPAKPATSATPTDSATVPASFAAPPKYTKH